MRAQLVAVLVAGLFLAGCGQDATAPILNSPVSPTIVTGSDGTGASTPSADNDVQAVPFRSEVVWTKTVNGGDPAPCQALHGNPPSGMIYLMRNTNEGSAVSTHLGAGDYENHTCVYGAMVNGRPAPAGWFADMRWTAANGDVLLAMSKFLYWTGQPGGSVAVDSLTFQDGGTGRFAFAEGDGMAYVNAPERTAVFEGTLRYGKKEK